MLDALTVTAPYSPEQEERIREAVEDLCDRLGVQMAAGKLCTTEPALQDLLAGRRPAKAMLVSLLAKQHGETVEQLLDPKRPKRTTTGGLPDPLPAHAAPASAPISGPISGPMSPASSGPSSVVMMPPLIGPPPKMEPTVVGPPVVFDPPPMSTPMPMPASRSTPPPAVPPIAAVAPPPQPPTSEPSDTGSTEPRLTLIEYASLSMGLELLPHREADVCDHYGLGDPTVRQRESDYWDAYLKTHARERREWPQTRERMRNYWMRFDGQIIAPPVQPTRTEPIESRASLPNPVPMATPMSPPAAQPEPPPISLAAYASLCVELHRSPAMAENTFAFYGLNDPASRERVSRYWAERFGLYTSERTEWEHLYHAKAQELEARASHVPAAPIANQYVAALKTTGDHAAPPTMTLNAYALLCVELEKKPKEREQVYKRHGLADPQKRRIAEDGWRARLERDAAERAKWQQLTDEIRADWMDF